MFENEKWFEYLDVPMRESVNLAYKLYEREGEMKDGLYDYSFVVFPMAKAYEGFLKKMLWSMGLISEEAREGKRFRIGKSMNPDLPNRFKDEEWVFDDLEKRCEERGLGMKGHARVMWEAWIEGRNRLFHYFTPKEGVISLDEAGKKLEMMKKAMEIGYELAK